MALGFGSTPQTTAGNTLGAFGFKPPATTSSSAFGFGNNLFGSKPLTAPVSTATGFSFGSINPPTTSTGSTAFGFGGTNAAIGGGFGVLGPKPATTASSLGFGGTTSLFGKPAVTTTTSAFTFGPPSTSTAASGFQFRTSTAPGTGFGTAPAQQPQAATPHNDALVMAAVHMPVVFNDERDGVLTKWNQLQAFWGTGTGYVNQNSSATFTPENPFSYFKAVGYSFMPRNKDEDGLVALVTNKRLNDLQDNQQASVNFLSSLLGNQPTLSLCVDSVRELPDKTTEMVVFLQERLPNGSVKRVLASLLCSYFCQTNISTQLKNAGVQQVISKASMSESVLQYYLDTPPAGLDPILWEQAKKDNPDPGNLLPVPIIGFSEVHKRIKHQEQHCISHQDRLDIIEGEIKTLQQSHATTMSRIEDYKRKHLLLSHRILKVIVQQEIHRKMGYGILEKEEQLRNKLEATQQELNAPTEFKSRLNELLSQIRLQNQTLGGQGMEGHGQLDPMFMDEIKAHLLQQQKGLQELISVVKDDMADLTLIEAGYTDNPPR